MIAGSDVLFIGMGRTSPAWYRCFLPAMAIGADWVGVYGQPPNLAIATGLVKGLTQRPKYEDYKVVVAQQPHGREWLDLVNRLRANGVIVLYEIDDYLHGVPKQKTHDSARAYTKKLLHAHELVMRACDGIICSTNYIARRYARWNRHVYILRNGLDVDRYQLTRPERSTINVGWCGATGHIAALLPWLNAIVPVLKERQDTTMVFVGQPQLAGPVAQLLGRPDRAIGVPFCAIEAYPAAMCLMDIALAPAQNTAWYRAKSDLRWLEASALKIPVVADSVVYDEIEDGVTGLLAETPTQAAEHVRTLCEDSELRERIGSAAREHLYRERTISALAPNWLEVFNAVAGEYESMSELVRAGR